MKTYNILLISAFILAGFSIEAFAHSDDAMHNERPPIGRYWTPVHGGISLMADYDNDVSVIKDQLELMKTKILQAGNDTKNAYYINWVDQNGQTPLAYAKDKINAMDQSSINYDYLENFIDFLIDNGALYEQPKEEL